MSDLMRAPTMTSKLRLHRNGVGWLVIEQTNPRPWFDRLCNWAYVLGAVPGGGWANAFGDRPETRWVNLTWHRRPYVLGIERQRWGWLLCKPWHRLRRGHWPGPCVALFGYTCGTCYPWPCCGATGDDHAAHCTGDAA